MGNTQASRHRVAFFCRGRILPEELSSLERSGIVFLVTRHIQLGQRVRVRLTLLSKTPSIFAMAPTGLGITGNIQLGMYGGIVLIIWPGVVRNSEDSNT